jgi:hypothetical protein
MGFDDIGHALIVYPSTDFAALPDRAEQRAGGDTGFVAPLANGRDWTGDGAPHYPDGRAQVTQRTKLSPAFAGVSFDIRPGGRYSWNA